MLRDHDAQHGTIEATLAGEFASLDEHVPDAQTLSLVGNDDDPPHTPFRLKSGQTLGAYRIHRPLGRGGMGEVYEAEHQESHHRVALKILSQSADSSAKRRKRFLREGMLAAAINHPNSLYVYGTDEVEGTQLIVMELAMGGTLKDRVEAEGPMPPAAAVDIILQVIDGLDAAHRAGVLHRDVKPANCFVDRDGSVKVGDFGLSISTTGLDSVLTASGAILGTPAFASPEQLRGDDLDVRADIYSVGATLYYLLTGRLPFEVTGSIKTIAAILEQVPQPPHRFVKTVPVALSHTVLKCLRKDAGKRFQSYEDLRNALLPFGSSAAQPATLWRRSGSGIIDALVALSPLLVVHLLVEAASQWHEFVLEWGFLIAYSTLLEGRWGISAGKLATGLRLHGRYSNPPGLARALSRSLLLWSLPMISETIVRIRAGESMAESPGTLTLLGLSSFSFLLMFGPARRANGWLALHDRWTGTRVVRRPASRSHQRLTSTTTLAEPHATQHELGPYAVSEAPDGLQPGHVLLGYDSRLKRSVWIHVCAPDTPPIRQARRDLSRAGRLRWLNGQRSAAGSWDAYEAEEGAPLLLQAQNTNSWGTVRPWLLDLAEVIRDAADEPDFAKRLRLDHVWIDAAGRALVLDFPAPGLPDQIPEKDLTHPMDPQSFVQRVAARAIGSTQPGAPGVVPASAQQLPLHATSLMGKLTARAFDSIDALVNELRRIVQLPIAVKRSLRLRQMLLAGSPALLLGLAVPGVKLAELVSLERRYPGFMMLEACLSEACSRPTGPEQAHLPFDTFRALQIYIAGPLREVVPDANVSLSKRPRLRKRQRDIFNASLKAYPQPTSQEVAWSQETLQAFLASNTSQQLVLRHARSLLDVGAFAMSLGLLALAPLSILTGFVFRGGLAFRAFGLAIVTRSGERASWRRIAVRSLLTWLPMLAILIWIVTLVAELRADPGTGFAHALGHTIGRRPLWIPGLSIVVAGVVWTLITPQRGPEDRIVGTYIVRE